MDDPLPEPTIFLIKAVILVLLFVLLFVFRVFRNAIDNCDCLEIDQKNEKSRSDLRILSINKNEQRFTAAYDLICCIISFACIFLLFSLFYVKVSLLIKSYELSAVMLIIGFSLVYHLFCTELSRKISSVNKEKVFAFSSMITLFFGNLFYPATYVFDKISVFILRIFGVKFDKSYDTPTESEIRQLVDEAEEIGELEESQKEMINNVFEFDDICVENVMTHRTDIVAIENTDDINELIKQAISEGYSRIPVYTDDLDNIIGIIHVKDLLPFVGKKIPSDISVKSILREVYFVPETKRCDDLFKEMTGKKAQMAVVVDEYGGTAGIITLEDLIESVFGSIQDEYDNEEVEIEQVSEKVFEIDGITDIEEASQTIGVDLPNGDYDTIGGMLTSILGHIPTSNESIEVNGVVLTVLDADDRKIDKIKAEITQMVDDIDL